MTNKAVIHTDRAPQAIGPYSQAIKANGFIFASGQIPLDPASGQLIEGDIRAQTERVLDNVRAVVEAAGERRGRRVLRDAEEAVAAAPDLRVRAGRGDERRHCERGDPRCP